MTKHPHLLIIVLTALAFAIVTGTLALYPLGCGQTSTNEATTTSTSTSTSSVPSSVQSTTSTLSASSTTSITTTTEPGTTSSTTTSTTATTLFSSSSHFGFVTSGVSYSDIAALGTAWVRPHAGPFSWDIVQPEEGTYDFSEVDPEVQSAQASGLHILATIWPYATWDQAAYTQESWWEIASGFEEELPLSRYKPNNFVAYGNFITALVERYDGDGFNDMPGLQYGIKYWEVLNEPEMEGSLVFFRAISGETLPASYLEILITTEAMIKEADPTATILHGGTAGSAPTDAFWGEVYNLGGSSYFDLANIHSINNGETNVLNSFNTLLSQNNVLNPVWMTELSFGSGNFGNADSGPTTLTDEEQAQMLVRSYAYGFGNGLQKIFYTTLQAESGMDASMQTEALIDISGSKRPIYYALQNMINKIESFSTVEVVATDQYRFTVSGNPVYLLWGSGTLPTEISGEVTVTDVTGGVSTKDASQITLTESPIFVEF